MGVDTKSGPSIAAALHETGLEGVAAAITPVFQCNAPAQFRTQVSIEQPIGNDGQMKTGRVGSGDPRRGQTSGGIDIASTKMSLPPEIRPSLNARGPTGAGGNQFPVVDPRFSSVPGGSGTGASFGSNIGVARSPVYGVQGIGDYSINDSGGIDASIAGGPQPALTVNHGPMPQIDERTYPFDPAEVSAPTESDSPGAQDPGDSNDGPRTEPDGEDAPCDDGDQPCDLFVDGTICATKVFADNLHIRWGITKTEIKANGTGTVTLTPQGKLCVGGDAASDSSENDDATESYSGTPPDSDTSVSQEEDGDDLPPCPEKGDKDREEIDEAGGNQESDPNSSPVGTTPEASGQSNTTPATVSVQVQ